MSTLLGDGGVLAFVLALTVVVVVGVVLVLGALLDDIDFDLRIGKFELHLGHPRRRRRRGHR